MSKRVFITGMAGFIGFHLASRLSASGYEVLGYDNYNDYYKVSLKRQREALLIGHGVEIIEGDLCDMPLLQASIAAFKPTHIVHLAAQAGVRYSLQNPKAYLSSNLEGFLNVLEVCRQFPGVKLVYASSSSVYGLNEKTPFAESDVTDRPVSLYGATKKANELMAHAYHHTYGIPMVGLRFFTVYGPWGRPDMAYYSFTNKILKGEEIDVYNHGQLSRDFTYIDDIIDGIITSMDYQTSPFALFNLGHHHPVALMDFIHVLEDALGRQAKIRYLPMQPGDVLTTYADIAHSHAELGFKPEISIQQGIPLFVEWYLENNSQS